MIDENITYEEAFEQSIPWIKTWYKLVDTRWGLEYDDYFQECALRFYSRLKPKYSAFECWCISKKAYNNILKDMLNSIRDTRNNQCKYSDVYRDSYKRQYYAETISISDYFETYQEKLSNIAYCLSQGYNTEEIANILGYAKTTIIKYTTRIRDIIAKQLSLTDWKQKSKVKNPKKMTKKRYETIKYAVKRKEELAKKIEYNNEVLTVKQWSEKLNIPKSALYHRLEEWSIERALTTPYRR